MTPKPAILRSDRMAWVALAVVSFVTAFWQLGSPDTVVFDETYGTFWAAYFTGDFYIDIHPPHLRLLFAALGWLGGYSGDYPAFQAAYGGHYYIVQRGFCCMLAALCPLLLARLCLHLGAARFWALIAGAAFALDNLRVTESRLTLPDGPLIFCILAAGLAFAEWRVSRRPLPLFTAALFAAFAVSIKWTALAFAVPVFLILVTEYRGNPRRTLTAAATFCGVLVVWYVGGFALHLSLLPNMGPGADFMTPEFNARLRGGPDAAPLSMWAAILELNRTMSAINASVGSHPYASKWWTWPLGIRGIYYWNIGDARIYLWPNLVILWTTTIMMVGLLFEQLVIWANNPLATLRSGAQNRRIWLLITYLANFLPYALITRPMFLYHYLPAMTIALAASAVLASHNNFNRRVALLWLCGVAAMFVYLAPLTYGDPLTKEQMDQRTLLPTWP